MSGYRFRIRTSSTAESAAQHIPKGSKEIKVRQYSGMEDGIFRLARWLVHCGKPEWRFYDSR